MATPITSPEQLSNLLVKRRIDLQLSQSEFGALIGKSQERVSKIERHPEKVTLDQIMTVLMALGMELQLVQKRSKPSGPSPRGEW